jgi:D-sedoheptulose 7-phosphate isomerase
MDERRILEIVAESVALKQRFFAEHVGQILEAGRMIAERLRAGGKVLAFGNGGSAADAQHFSGELVVRFLRARRALAALALTTDPSVLTATANDLGYDQVFKRQVEAHGQPGDVAFGISTSGRSPSVVLAMQEARERGLFTVALTGQGGGLLPPLADVLIDVPHAETPRIQEVHGMIVHILCEIVEEEATR